METIRNYLETMFQGLPHTQEMQRIKEDLLANMEDRYQELKSQGSSENEAIGKVISEFGNIDELLGELGIGPNGQEYDFEKEETILLSEAEADDYVGKVQQNGKYVAMGVSIILFGVSLLIFMNQILEIQVLGHGVPDNIKSYLPIICFFVFLVPAVGLFVYSGMRMESFVFIEKGEFVLSSITRNHLRQKYEESKEGYHMNILFGVILCVLSPIILFISGLFGENAMVFGICLMLLFIAAGVNLLIVAGTRSEGYKKILQMEEYSVKRRKQNKVIGAVASVVWPLATAIFFITGFCFGQWGKAWIIFPVVGVLFGAFSSICYGVSGDKR